MCSSDLHRPYRLLFLARSLAGPALARAVAVMLSWRRSAGEVPVVMARAPGHDFCHEHCATARKPARRACARPVVADNRGVRVLADKSVVLGVCGLLALFSGATQAADTADAAGPAAVVWLLLAVITSGLCAVADRRRALIVIPGAYLLLGCSTTASVPGAPLVVYDLVRIAART